MNTTTTTSEYKDTRSVQSIESGNIVRSHNVIPMVDDSPVKTNEALQVGSFRRSLRTIKKWISHGEKAATLPRLEKGMYGTQVIEKMRDCVPWNCEGEREQQDDTETGLSYEMRQSTTSTKKKLFVGIYSFITLFGLFVFAYFDYYSASDIGATTIMSCDSKFWSNKSHFDSSCGVQGEKCLPSINTTMVVRCPRWCDFSNGNIYGSDVYTATSSVCQAAKHANLYSSYYGGCFGVRILGEQLSFSSSLRNGQESLATSWFPMAFEFFETETGHCKSYRPFIDLYIFAVLFIMVVFVVPNKGYMLVVIVVVSWIYLTTNTSGSNLNDYVVLLNNSFVNLMVALIISVSLWKFSIRQTMPSVLRLPLDFLIFYLVPFWGGIRMDSIVFLGVNLSLSSDIFLSPEYIVGFVSFVVFFIPAVILQCRLYLLHGGFSVRGFKVLIFVGILFVITLCFSSALSLHVHHFFVGILGAFFFRGQPKWRYSIVFQAICLGVFVNGIIVWGLAPFFDQMGDVVSSFETQDLDYLLWTNVSTTESSITLQFAAFNDLDQYHKCYVIGRRLSDEIPFLNSLDQSRDLSIITPNHGTKFLPWMISLNSVLMHEGSLLLSDDGFSYSFTIPDVPQNVPFTVVVGRAGAADTTILNITLDGEARPLWIPSGKSADPSEWYCNRLYDLNIF